MKSLTNVENLVVLPNHRVFMVLGIQTDINDLRKSAL